MMAADLLEEITAARQELNMVVTRVQSLQNRLDDLALRVTERRNGGPRRLVDLEGIWEGADFGWTEIQAAEYRLPLDLP